jgi:hypothetical protein
MTSLFRWIVFMIVGVVIVLIINYAYHHHRV